VPGSYLRKYFPISSDVVARLEKALDQGRISMRGYDRCLRVAWSVADLAGRDTPNEYDIAKAIFLRGSDLAVGGANG
jgi:magnesium chelatase family protein